MTTAGMIRVWLLGPLALAAALLIAARWAPEPAARFHGAQVAVIGSSLTAYAVPESGPDLILTGADHWRVGISLPSEAQLLDLLDRAVAERPRLILLEGNALTTQFALDPRREVCVAPAGRLRQAAKRIQTGAVDALRRLFGARTSLDGMGEPTGLNRPQVIDQALLKAFYPLAIRQPCDEPRLRAAIARARAQGTMLALVVLPRSPAGERWLGVAQSRDARAEVDRLATRLGVPLFEPSGVWQDAEFTDHAHLNTVGRTRFVSALRDWLEAQR